MKISNLLSLPKANRIEPNILFNWLPSNLASLAAAAVILATAVVAMQKFQETKMPENKSVAWYMANPQEALVKNKECYDNPKLKTTENCVNSLQALEITHKGPNS
ncbi:MAG: EexN family lipoprotein [Methyloglobulus sp.]|nr:EexN family lipoprotein [Methyloglobulus sp.]